MTPRHTLAAAGALLLSLAGPARAGGEPAGAETAVDRDRLETVEEATEGFANRLFDFSWDSRAGDASLLADYVAPRLTQGRILTRPGAPADSWKWVQQRAWSAAGEARPMTRRELLADWQQVLDHFASIEDVRFKVKSSSPTSKPGQDLHVHAKFKMWIVGRNRDGQREWIRGTGEADGVRTADRWSITSLAFDAMTSLVGTRDLFSEVGGPAGVAAEDPPFAERQAYGPLAHGAAAGDVDGDGFLDVFVTGIDGAKLYLNRGDGTFAESAAGVHARVFEKPGVAPLFLDFDNDGDQDLFVSSIGRQVLLENRLVPDGKLDFHDVSSRAGVAVLAFGFSATAADVNGDGRTDIYVACYNDYGAVIPDSWDAASNGTPNLLFVNQGRGRFREEAAARGVADARWSYAATFADLDDDGDPDLVVGDDFGPGITVYRNDGGRFADATRDWGLDKPGYSMGVAAGDFDNDGDLDLHVTNMSSNAGNRIVGRFAPGTIPDEPRIKALFAGNWLFENTGGGRFRDVTATAGPFSGSWAFGGGFFDADADGFQDLYTPNGFISGKLPHDT